ncbi:hypothetical protein ACHAXT_012228 [Thalassiosira profunda]
MADSDDHTAPAASEEEAAAAGDAAQDPPSDALASLAVADDGAPSAEAAGAEAAPPEDPADRPAAAEEPAAPAAPAAQQLPLNVPHLAALDDDAAAAQLDNEFLSLLPPCILPRIDKLKELNEKREEILEEYRLERAALEKKFNAKMVPLYEERRGVVNGERDEEIAAASNEEKEDAGGAAAAEGAVEDASDDEGAQVGQVGDEEDVKGIPQFWACACGHVDVIAELITEADVDCLDHLTNVACADFPDGRGFELVFHFSPNDFFTNKTLVKRYEIPNLLLDDEPILQKVTGTDINWKAGRSLTYREITKKQRKKGGPNAGQIRTVTKKERTESFFHFFTPPKMPALTEVMDEEEADMVEEAFDRDYDVAQAFRGHLIPKAVLWFTGEAMDDGFDDGMMEGMLEGEEGEEGLQMRAPFVSNGPGGEGAGNNGNNPFPPPAAGDGANPECNQN